MERLDNRDLQILRMLQKNCKTSIKHIAKTIDSPITTVFAKIKRMEKRGIIKKYTALLDAQKLHKGATAFVLVSVSYRVKESMPLSQRKIAHDITKFPEVQETHIITGDWDIIVKVKEKDVEAIGRFVIDNLRMVKGIEKTLTCMVFETAKETTDIDLRASKTFSKSFEI